MFCRRITALMFCGLMLPVTLRAEEPSSATLPTEPASPQTIAQWVAELDDNHFDTRERAQLSLEAAGPPALNAVAQTAESGSLESSTRALNILLSWAESSDNTLRLDSLERIAKLPQRPTEAAMAEEILADAREQAALAKIAELGGIHTGDRQYGGALILNQNGRQVGPTQIIIGAHWKGGVEGLRHLKEVRRATTVSLHSSPLGDEAIPVLLELGHVRRIELYGTKFSSEGVANFKSALNPNTTLAVRSGAQLGIQGFQSTGLAQVQQVIEGSAAERAGLRTGDIITQVDGEKIKDFTALTDRIATYQPGDSATLNVTRPNQDRTNSSEIEIKVTFDKWGDKRNPPTFVQPEGQQIQGQILPPHTIRLERR